MATELLCEKYATLRYANAGAVSAKAFIVVGVAVVMALNTYAATEEGAYVCCADKLRVPKATGQAWTAGAKVYYDAAAGKFTTTASGNTVAGMIVAPAASGDTEGKIALSPFFG